jgi:hypothetical protein
VKDPNEKEKAYSILFTPSNPEDDEFAKEIENAVEKIEGVLKSKLSLIGKKSEG